MTGSFYVDLGSFKLFLLKQNIKNCISIICPKIFRLQVYEIIFADFNHRTEYFDLVIKSGNPLQNPCVYHAFSVLLRAI